MIVKNILLLLSCLLALSSTAQIYEDFEGDVFPPAGWLVTDNGIGINQSWTGHVLNGNRRAYINNENIGIGNTSEDWLITPAITIEGADILSFITSQTILGNQGTIYSVRVSTTSQTDMSSFQPLDTWNENDLNVSFSSADTKYVSLSDYQGQTVYIAFVKTYYQPTNSLSGDRWIVDNVAVSPISAQSNIIYGTASYSYLNDCENSANSILTNPVTFTHNNATYAGYSFIIPTTDLNQDLTVTSHSTSDYYLVSPASHTFNFTDYGNVGNADFCVQILPGEPIHDVGVWFYPATAPMPGFDFPMTVKVLNYGTEPENGTVSYYFQDDRMDFISAEPNIVTQTGDYISWPFSNLQPGETQIFELTFNLNSPTETPAVNLGDLLVNTASVSIPVDYQPYNNNVARTCLVGSSYDPNDKHVAEGASITPLQSQEPLHYTIRFQNTGTSAASFVKIAELLDSDLDLSTIEFLGASHIFNASLVGNRLEFKFNNINLPPMSDSPEGSQGFVNYRIKPSSNQVGTVFNGSAEIYFDYNYPIITNNVITTITETLHNPDFGRTDVVKIAPNPATDMISFDLGNSTLQGLSVYNILGQKVGDFSAQNNLLNISELQSGVYILELLLDSGKVTKKFIKN